MGLVIMPTFQISKLGCKEGSDICPSSLSGYKGVKLELGPACLTYKEEAVTKTRGLQGESSSPNGAYTHAPLSLEVQIQLRC